MDERERPDQRMPEDPWGIKEPHDVLAAEEFGMPTRDQRYPPDPTGIQDAHDVLAAEEFAMPAPEPRTPGDETLRDPRAWLLAAGLAVLALALLLRRRR